MAYSLLFHEDRVTRYLREYESLSRQARIRLFANLHSDLGVHGDYYRNDETRRLAPGSDYLWYEILLSGLAAPPARRRRGAGGGSAG